MVKYSDMERNLGEPDHERDDGYYFSWIRPHTMVIDTEECNGNIITWEFQFDPDQDNYMVWHTTLS